jgi:hypothetical protein
MRTGILMSVMAVTAACVTGPANAQNAVFGQWRVTGSTCAPGGCALSPAETESWLGRIAIYGDTIARFAEHSCAHPAYMVDYWPADGSYGGARFADLGLAGDSAMVVVIRCPGQPPTSSLDNAWQVPGAFLIVKDPEHLLTEWEGVFLELTRQTGEPPEPR